MGAGRKYFFMADSKGFTLVELMVVTAIVAILAAVAAPAYINYVNRSKQGQAESMLMTARLEQEEHYTDYGQYAQTIQCLPSFGNSCSAAAANTFGGYTFTLVSPTTNSFQVQAARTLNGVSDQLTVSANSISPTVQTPNAIGFSIFQWLFGH
jgi:prepilin-type N-terminal cleavage/methylation domain-containing protein